MELLEGQKGMNKREYLGLFVGILIVGSFGITLYPRRLAVATEETITNVAKNYAHEQLFKIMLHLDDAKKAVNDDAKESALAKAKKNLKKIQRTVEYSQQVLAETLARETEMEKEAEKTEMKKALMFNTQAAKDNIREIQQIAQHAEWLIEQATLKPAVVTKKEKVTSKLEELI